MPPVAIVGLPRTGTTHLHNLLAAAGTFRTLPYWESMEPFPLPSGRVSSRTRGVPGWTSRST